MKVIPVRKGLKWAIEYSCNDGDCSVMPIRFWTKVAAKEFAKQLRRAYRDGLNSGSSPVGKIDD